MSEAIDTAVFDLDGTITRHDTTLPYLLGFLRPRPLRCLRTAHLPAVVTLHAVGLRDNARVKEAFLRAMVGGAARAEVEARTESFVDRILVGGLRSGARSAIEWHRARGHRLVLATASIDLYVVRIGQRLGFSDIICTRTAWNADGRLSGRIEGVNCYGPAKLRAVQALLGEDPAGVAAYSDHVSDLALLEWSSRPTAVNPIAALRRIAEGRSIPIADWDSS